MRITRFWTCVLGLALLAMLPVARASDEMVRLAPGGGSELTLPRPFDAVLIANPNIVDVQTRTDRSVFLKGLNPGASNVIFLDERSIAIINIQVVVGDART